MADHTEGQAAFDSFVDAFSAKMDEPDTSGTSTTALEPEPDANEPAERDGAASSPALLEGADTDAADSAETDADNAEGTDDEIDDDADQETTEIRKLAEKHGVPMSVDDLPAEARPIVKARLKQVEAGLTRSFQELSAERKRLATYRAEERFRSENPEYAILEAIEKDPALLEKVNELMTKTQDTPEYGEVVKHQREQKRAAAHTAVDSEMRTAETRLNRGRELQQLVVGETTKLGLPMELVEDSIVQAIKDRAAAGAEISDAEVKQIITAKHAAFRKATDGRRAANRQQYVADKVKDQRTTSPRARPGQGNAPTPAPRKEKVRTAEEGITEFADRLWPGEK